MQHRSASPITKPAGERSGNVLQAAHARLAEAEACRRAGKLNRARALCEALLAEYPDYVGALQTLGVVQLATKAHRQALSCFFQAAMLCPKDWVNLTNLGNAYLRLGAREAAAQVLEQARQLKPDDPGIHWSLAELHREDRDYAGAAEAYRTVLSLSPFDADAAHGLGDTLMQLGDVAASGARPEAGARAQSGVGGDPLFTLAASLRGGGFRRHWSVSTGCCCKKDRTGRISRSSSA